MGKKTTTTILSMVLVIPWLFKHLGGSKTPITQEVKSEYYLRGR